MYAVIETGGKQYKVAVGDRLKVEKLTVAEGESVQIPRVLMVADGGQVKVGAPATEIAVSATVLGHGRGERIRVFKMKRRKNYRRTQGHRQAYTELVITAIGSDGGKAVAKTETAAGATAGGTAAASGAAAGGKAAAGQEQKPKPAEKAIAEHETSVAAGEESAPARSTSTE